MEQNKSLDLQKLVKNFNDEKNCHSKPMPVAARLLDIQSELGELSKEYLKPTSYGTKDFVVTDDYKLELGDVLYSLFSLANETGVDASECLNKVIEKYKNRLNKKNTLDSRADK